MKTKTIALIVVLAVSLLVAPSIVSQGQPVIVDHTNVDLFHQIPDDVLARARSKSSVFLDKSVGDNISTGLRCLDGTGTASCNEPLALLGITPSGKYSRANIQYTYFNAAGCGAWYELVGCFISQTSSMNHDYMSYGISYMEVDDPAAVNYFSAPHVGQYEGYLSGRGKPVIHWTSSLSRKQQSEMPFNEIMRGHVKAGQYLFDLADILSHDLSGVPCQNLSGGISGICHPLYTTQTQPNAGHLNKMGQIRAAMGYWVLLAFLEGWTPGAPTPIPPTESPLPEPTGTPTPQPTTTPQPPTPLITSRQCRMIWAALSFWQSTMPTGAEWWAYATNSGQEPSFNESEIQSLIYLVQHTQCRWR